MSRNIIAIYNTGSQYFQAGLTEKARLYREFAYALISPEVRK